VASVATIVTLSGPLTQLVPTAVKMAAAHQGAKAPVPVRGPAGDPALRVAPESLRRAGLVSILRRVR